jgi:ferrochelatase
MKAVLLVNLGSPASFSVADVRRYLREFLMDEFVIDLPWLARFCLVHFLILPFRPKKTAAAYKTIWTKEGAPLVVISRKLQQELQKCLDLPVALAMRYQNPAIPNVLAELVEKGVDQILLVPLYPHYALSSFKTVVEKVRRCIQRQHLRIKLEVLNPIYDDPLYIDALVASAKTYLSLPHDHLLFTFHGLPERHIHKTDSSGKHCLKTNDCCRGIHPVHAFCYRAQVLKTMEAFAKKAILKEGSFSFSFQSRLGREQWLKPYTDHELAFLPQQGKKRILVICPSFVSDCLETLEEIGMRGKETFLKAGGTEFQMIPCLNTHEKWIEALASLIQRYCSDAVKGV